MTNQIREILEQAEAEWASQGRTEEQKWAVRNFTLTVLSV